MRKRKRLFFFLFSVIFFTVSAYSMVHFPPSYIFSIHSLSLPLFPFVLLFACAFVCFFLSFLTHSLINGFLITACLASYLYLRSLGLTSAFFLIIILALMGMVELFFINKK